MIRRIERADGVRFQVYVQAGGKKRYVGSYLSEREAKEAEEDERVTQRRIERGELPRDVDTRRTFSAGVKTWLGVLEKKDSRSWSEYSNRVELYLTPAFGDLAIVDIARADVTRWRDELSHKVSNATVNTVMGTLSAAFTFFVERNWIDANPCHRVKRLKQDARVFPWLQSTEAITRLLAELPHKWRTLVAFLVGTGCRLDEALLLTWDDVDLEHRLVTLRRTKSNKVRHVPVFDAVLPVLKEMKIQRGTEPFLWPGGRPGKRLSQPSIRKPFKAAVARAKLPRELRLHDLRHTFASLFLVDGGDIFKLSRILGHKSVAITERTYSHLKPDAFEADYGRVAFRMPSDAKIIPFAAAQ